MIRGQPVGIPKIQHGVLHYGPAALTPIRRHEKRPIKRQLMYA